MRERKEHLETWKPQFLQQLLQQPHMLPLQLMPLLPQPPQLLPPQPQSPPPMPLPQLLPPPQPLQQQHLSRIVHFGSEWTQAGAVPCNRIVGRKRRIIAEAHSPTKRARRMRERKEKLERWKQQQQPPQ